VATKNKGATHTTERERKFLVDERPKKLSRYPHMLIEQGYLAIESDDHVATEVRIRRSGDHTVLTVKQGRGEERLEREVPLPRRAARALWPLTKGRRIRKTRYRIPWRTSTIELDIYRGKLKGLVVAEVEFPSLAAMRRFEPPPWFGREVTGRDELANSRLAVSGWKRNQRSKR
jgi:CYTH domain-containing protein